MVMEGHKDLLSLRYIVPVGCNRATPRLPPET